MTDRQHYDAIIIGSGQGGNPLAGALAAAGRHTAVIEREHVGGTCINEGCTPTKTMVASAETAHAARHSEDYGVETGPVAVDLRRVVERKQEIVDSFRTGNEKRLEDAENLDLIRGEASFTGPRELEVSLNGGGTLQVTAETVVINTGTSPSLPPVEGLDQVPTLNSTTIMELEELPEHLLILGGGYIAVEFAQMFRRYGSEVTVVQRGPQLLSREDPDVAEEMANILRGEGIEVLLETQAEGAEEADGGIRLSVTGGRSLSGSHLLVAAGRRPNTDALNLEATGIEAGKRGHVQVNDRLETGAEGVYAIGDVKGGPAFTHVSYDDYRILEKNLLRDGDASIEGRLVSYTVFTNPQLGRVGLSEREAREEGLDVRVAKIPMGYVARAIETGDTRGVMKAVVNAETGQILGCAVLGIEGGEVMAMVQVAMMGGLHYTALRDGVFSHPTLAESLNTLFAVVEG